MSSPPWDVPVPYVPDWAGLRAGNKAVQKPLDFIDKPCGRIGPLICNVTKADRE